MRLALAVVVALLLGGAAHAQTSGGPVSPAGYAPVPSWLPSTLPGSNNPFYSQGTAPSGTLSPLSQIVVANTAHNEIVGMDGQTTANSNIFYSPTATFTSLDVGKAIIVNGAGTGGADLITTISALGADSNHVVMAANAATTTPWYTVGRAIHYAGSTLIGSYVIGDVLTVSGGTQITAGQFTVTSVQVAAATVNAGGSGGTTGTCMLTGTTGVTQTGGTIGASGYTGGWFTATGTVSGGSISGPIAVTFGGDYSTPPTSLTAEPITSNCGLIGATLTIQMAPLGLKAATAGHYTALPTDPVLTTGGSGSGEQLHINNVVNNTAGMTRATLNIDQPGGFWAYGTDDTAAINAVISQAIAINGIALLPNGRSLVLGAIQIPYTGTNLPTQGALRITGTAFQSGYLGQGNGFGVIPLNGSVLDLRFAGDGGTHIAKIDTRGGGKLEIDHLVLADGGTDNFLFGQTTNTTVALHDLLVQGNPTCYQMTCQQNFMSFGGLTNASSTLQTNASTDGFQGYGSYVRDVQVEHIQEGFEFGGSANGIPLINANAGQTNGTYSTTAGFFHFYGAGLGTTENTIVGGTQEITGYPYMVMSTHVGSSINTGNTFESLGINDSQNSLGNPVIGAFYFDGNSNYSSVRAPYEESFIAATYVEGSGANGLLGTLVAGGAAQPSVFTQNAAFLNHLDVGNTINDFPIELGSSLITQYVMRLNSANSGTNCGPVLILSEAYVNFGYVGSDSAINGGTCDNSLRVQSNGSTLNLAVQGTVEQSITTALATIKLPLTLTALATGGTYTQAACLTSSGSLQGDTSGTICGLSAARFKNLIDDPIDPKGLLTLRTESWRYKPKYQDRGKVEHVGLIADDVAKMDPRCAVRDKDGRVSNYSDRCIEAYLVAMVKMQQRQIADLRAAQHHRAERAE